MRVVPTSGLTEEEIDAHHRRGRAAQRRRRARSASVAELKLQLETLLYTTERALAEYGHVLAQQEREAIASEIARRQSVMRVGTSADELRRTLRRLERSAQKIGEAMYAQAARGERRAARPSRSGAERDYYEVLGVPRDADAADA